MIGRMLILACAAALLSGCAARTRGVQPIALLPSAGTRTATEFAREESAALFVGVSDFRKDKSLVNVRYAVDDAIDLAFVLALDARVRLVEPGRVVLALSGQPRKAQSQQHLDALVTHGATVAPADHEGVLALLESQANAAGPNGILIVSFATHGVTDEGTQYLLAESSLVRHLETSISERKLRDITSRSRAARSLILVDACRERLTSARTTAADPRSAAPDHRNRALGVANGQVVMSAAASGQWAYDDDARRNGVFTAAVIDGLRCRAPIDERGFVTAEMLARYVEEQVRFWIQRNRDPAAKRATEYTAEGDAGGMPLAACKDGTTAPQPAKVTTFDGTFQVFDASGVRLWGAELSGRVVRAEVADLDGDDRNEVVAASEGGEDSGRIVVYDAAGKRRWTADVTGPLNYEGGHSGRMAVRMFVTADLFRRGSRQIVVLSLDAQGWYQARLCIYDSDGKLIGSYWHPGHLDKVVVASRTAGDDPRIIVAGVNNDLKTPLRVDHYVSGVMMFDPANVDGEGPPYFGHAGKGSQLWYGVVLPGYLPIERLEVEDLDHDGTNEILVWTANQSLYLDFDAKVVSIGRGDGAQRDVQFGLIVPGER